MQSRHPRVYRHPRLLQHFAVFVHPWIPLVIPVVCVISCISDFFAVLATTLSLQTMPIPIFSHTNHQVFFCRCFSKQTGSCARRLVEIAVSNYWAVSCFYGTVISPSVRDSPLFLLYPGAQVPARRICSFAQYNGDCFASDLPESSF